MSAKEIVVRGDSLYGKMRAKVLVREDPKGLGRVGVYIPRIMGIIADANESKEKLSTTPSSTSLDDNNKLDSSSSVTETNYVWANRISYDFLTNTESCGEWRIPPVGAQIFVEFIDGDPQQLYYFPFGPCDLQNAKKLQNSAKDGSPDQELVYLSLTGDSIGFDHSDSKDEVFITMKNGEQIKIDSVNDEVTVLTKDSGCKVSMKEKIIKVTADTLNAEVKEANIKASSKVVVESSGDLVLSSPDSKTWQPNCLPNCLLTGGPHGGKGAGITMLKGAK